jgi:ABC-type amino acid transport system permease subunit
MLMLESYVLPTGVTLTFFGASAALSLAIAIGYLLALQLRVVWVSMAVTSLIEVSRGVPTVVFVLLMGNLGMAQQFGWLEIDGLLPGVSPGFTSTAVFVILGLAFSSSGHLARLIGAALATVPDDVATYARTLRLRPVPHLALLLRECAPALVGPVAARLTHHLHNTAFIALFPIADIFATMRRNVTETAMVIEHLAIAATAFLMIGFGISALAAAVERTLTGRGRRVARPIMQTESTQ